jgi:transcriptional regulator with XRE-family HTH domain
MARNQTEERQIRERIGRVIEARRIVRGLGVEELAALARIDLSQLLRVRKGTSGVSLYSLSRIAHALGWTLGELVYVAFPPGKNKGRRPLVPSRRAARSTPHDKHVS